MLVSLRDRHADLTSPLVWPACPAHYECTIAGYLSRRLTLYMLICKGKPRAWVRGAPDVSSDRCSRYLRQCQSNLNCPRLKYKIVIETETTTTKPMSIVTCAVHSLSQLHQLPLKSRRILTYRQLPPFAEPTTAVKW